MNKSKIANILHLFGSYATYVVSDNVIPDVVNIANVRNEAGNEVVYLGWDDSEGLEYRIKFTEEGLSEARVADGNLVMEDTEGDEITIAFMESRKYSLVDENID
jgi:hypothetical protein